MAAVDQGAAAGPPVGAQLYPDAFPRLQILCDVACETNPVEIIETRYPAAVTLVAIAGNPELSNIIMDAHMEDFSTIIGDEEELSERIAFENSISTKNKNENQIDSNYGPIIIGKSEIPVIHAAAAAPVINANYTNLLFFISNFGAGHANMITLNSLMFYLHILIYGTFGIQIQQPVFIYNNILLVRNLVHRVDISSLMPKYSFNILCEKEPLLQTRLTAGRENGMGALLERFICKTLQPFFDSIRAPPPAAALPQGFTKVKLIAPTESNNIWQIKLSVFENDFILVSLQIINVKAEYLIPANITNEQATIEQTYTGLVRARWTINSDIRHDNPIIPSITVILNGLQAQLNPTPQNVLKYFSHNLCFSLYNKCLSKDFNCLCSLSEVDTKMLKIIVGIVIGVSRGFDDFYTFIQLFLNNLVDTLINKKKQYFLFGLLNLISCSYQDRYTLETKAYEVIFDKAPYFNLFLESMRLIELVNRQCAAIPINIVMGGGKQYSLFQIALNNYFNTFGRNVAGSYFYTTFNTGDFVNPGDPTKIPDLTKLIEFLYHANVKPAADADFGMFHPGNDDEGSPHTALGSTMCMSVCMLLQISLKKKIDNLFVQPPLATPPNARHYDIDIGNSCIGNPPTTLSSLRINLHNSYIFYSEVIRTTPPATPEAALIYGLLPTIINQFFTGIIPAGTSIASVISPYDFVLKGTMENYIIHILDSVYEFNPGGLGQWNIDPDTKRAYAETLKPFMFTSQGFSSPLKGIFDIFYTLFIIENFANRSLVTQKINKELKRIAICAQVLYINFDQLLGFHILRVYPAPSVPLAPAQEADPTLLAIYSIMHTLQHMILIGYNGSNLLDTAVFAGIMNTYVTFVSQLIVLNTELLFYCAPHNPTTRTFTNIESYFMNFLIYSSPPPPHDPPHPPYPHPGIPVINTSGATLVELCDTTAVANPLFPRRIIAANPEDIILRSLYCIPNVITQLYTLNILNGFPYVHSLYKNKLYAACRDTVNKSEGVIAIASAYQSFLWDKEKRSNIRLQEDTDETDTVCSPKLVNVLGIMEVLNITGNAGLNGLIDSLNPCWHDFPNPNHDLLDLNTVLVGSNTNLDDVIFNAVANDNLGMFLIFSWFLTSIFGIKTKSKPSKILALGRTYLKLFVESYRAVVASRQGRPENELFRCRFAIPNLPVVHRGDNEVRADGVEVYFECNHADILCLTYSSFNIKEALDKYRNLQNDYGIHGENGNEVVKKIQIVNPQQQRNAPQVLGIKFKSQVFQKVILQQLLTRFSILPTGKQFTITASHNMGTLLRELHTKYKTYILLGGPHQNQIQPRIFANLCITLINALLHRVRLLNIYTPGKHDVSKFENFPKIDDVCTSLYFRTRWIIYLVSGMLGIRDIDNGTTPSFVYKNMKLFILLLKYLINIGEQSELPSYIYNVLITFNTIGFNININLQILEQVLVLIDSEYPNIDDVCLVRNSGLIVEREPQPEDKNPKKSKKKIPPKKVPEVEKKSDTGVIKEKISTAVDKTKTEAIKAIIGLKLKGIEPPGVPKGPKRRGAGARSGGTIRIRNPRSPKKINNHTRKNKYKRNNKNKNKKHKSSPKYRKINPSSRSGSQSNKKKSKSTLPQKNVTFKRRRYNNK